VIGLILFNELIWNKYIVNPTDWDALKEEPGRPAIGSQINSDNMMAILQPGKGFHVYLVARGFWGWKINDEIAIPNDRNSEPFTAEKQSLKLKGKKEIDVILIVSRDKEIDDFIVYDDSGEEYHLNRVVNKEGQIDLYYIHSEKKITGELTNEAYSANDQLLYKD